MRFFLGCISPSRSQKMGAWADALLMFRLPGLLRFRVLGLGFGVQGLQQKVALNSKTNRQVSRYNGCLLRILKMVFSLIRVQGTRIFPNKRRIRRIPKKG